MSSVKDVIRNNLISIQKLNQEVESLKSNNDVEVLKSSIANLELRMNELTELVDVIKCKCDTNNCSTNKKEPVSVEVSVSVEEPVSVDENIQLNVE